MLNSILSPDALKGIRIGISVSGSTDLERLGLLETHFRLALGEIARCVLISGGALAYGGHLEPTGYTTFLEEELQKYARRDNPLLVCLAWPIHNNISLTELENHKHKLGLYGKIICLNVDGQELDPMIGRENQPQVIQDAEIRTKSFTALRKYMTENTQGRVLIGGKRHGFQGALPGLIEEAILSLETSQPLYLAGGFGGITFDMIRALNIDDGNWLPLIPSEIAEDQRTQNGLSLLAEMAKSPGWKGLNNGLTDEENKRLAATHRPGEVASLVSLGMGRKFTSKTI